MAKHARVREKYGISSEQRRWTAESSCRGLPCSARARDLVDLCAQIWEKRQRSLGSSDPDCLKKCVYIVDISQDGSREPCAERCRSLVSNSSLFCYSRDRLLVPKEHLLLLGWPQCVRVQHLSPTAQRDLAGESMSPPCVGLAALSACLGLEDRSLFQRAAGPG